MVMGVEMIGLCRRDSSSGEGSARLTGRPAAAVNRMTLIRLIRALPDLARETSSVHGPLPQIWSMMFDRAPATGVQRVVRQAAASSRLATNLRITMNVHR
jgi:hypothetical protein